MKKHIIIIISLIFLSSFSFAQQINIHTQKGTDTYNLADIDSITFNIGSVTDIDGNVYQTVKIGDQWWMTENLKVTHYRNGDPISNITDDSEWADLTTSAYCNYNNNSNNVTTYGRLYNWYAVNDSRNIAPEGWHIPTDEEWKQLEMHLGMSQAEADDTGYRGTNEGSKIAGNAALWADGVLEDNTGFGESGLYALPGGDRNHEGDFNGIGTYATFWSSTESSNDAWSRYLPNNHSDILRHEINKRYGFSVRCVKD